MLGNDRLLVNGAVKGPYLRPGGVRAFAPTFLRPFVPALTHWPLPPTVRGRVRDNSRRVWRGNPGEDHLASGAHWMSGQTSCQMTEQS